MLLDGKTAIVHGAGGAIGAAVAQEFAREGARVFLAGRRMAPLEAVVAMITGAGGQAEAAEVDALDERAVDRHAAEVVESAGAVDVVLNAVGFGPKRVQSPLLVDLSLEDFTAPIVRWTSTQFLTARAAARHMTARGSGVVLMLSASPARMAVGRTAGFGVACAAIEGLTRSLAAELGPSGVRVVCLRPHRIAETLLDEPGLPLPADELRAILEDMTLVKRLPTLDDVAHTAAFLASDRSAALTGTVANLTGGMSAD